MKFGLNWKGAVGIFVIFIILLGVFLFIKTLRKETAKETPRIKEKEETIEEKGRVIKGAQREIDENVLSEEKERVINAARRDFEELVKREEVEKDLKETVERARNIR